MGELSLRTVQAVLWELQDTIEAGLIPDDELWRRSRELAPPWGTVVGESLQELRSRGASLLPTVKRLRALVENSLENLQESRARSAQAGFQAFTCLALVPLASAGLWVLIPEVRAHAMVWFTGTAAALGGGVGGAYWIRRLADQARWGGLPLKARGWPFGAQCAGERFLALVRGGTPPDLAWNGALDFLARHAPELAHTWGAQIWVPTPAFVRAPGRSTQALLGAGDSFRKAIQSSLMQGKPCLERVEAALTSLTQELRACVDQELSVLATRVLKPLFVCVAPGVLGLLALSLWLAFSESMGRM